MKRMEEFSSSPTWCGFLFSQSSSSSATKIRRSLNKQLVYLYLFIYFWKKKPTWILFGGLASEKGVMEVRDVRLLVGPKMSRIPFLAAWYYYIAPRAAALAWRDEPKCVCIPQSLCPRLVWIVKILNCCLRWMQCNGDPRWKKEIERKKEKFSYNTNSMCYMHVFNYVCVCVLLGAAIRSSSYFIFHPSVLLVVWKRWQNKSETVQIFM